jgi:organic radical activating enzyme
MSPALDTSKMSAELRRKTIEVTTGRLLVTDFRNTEQAKDFTKPPNCDGVGRIRHFHRFGSKGWPLNPVPIDPALHKLEGEPADILMTQAFQNASCNWRCWYCYVPFSLLSANPKNSRWVSPDDLLDLYERDSPKLRVIDLSGGQPDLTPEWVPWMMRALTRRGLSKQTYLWSDDNLSTDYFWRYLTTEDIALIQGYPNYGKVCCFKGFSPSSFAFNTRADASLYDQQFTLFAKYGELNIDLYGYATFTTIDESTIPRDMADFCDRLQSISVNLPLRVVPLEIRAFTPTKSRMRVDHERALKLQWSAIECWKSELNRRFAPELLSLPIYDILL